MNNMNMNNMKVSSGYIKKIFLALGKIFFQDSVEVTPGKKKKGNILNYIVLSFHGNKYLLELVK